MRFVFDANILMAVLIGGRAFHKVIFETFDVITPEYALTEIDKYSDYIVAKSKLNWQEYSRYAHTVFANLTVVPVHLMEPDAVKKASEIVGDVDPKDISYLALSIQTDCILVTRDKPVVETARRKGFRRVMLYDEFLRQYS